MNEIESVKPALSVVLDDGDWIVNSVGPIGKAMAQAILSLAAGARKVTVVTDGEMKVMKRNGNGNGNGTGTGTANAPVLQQQNTKRPSSPEPVEPISPDIQDQFAADIEAGVTGEQANGEQPEIGRAHV